VQSEQEDMTRSALSDQTLSSDRETALEIQSEVEARLSPERLDLLKRTLEVRRLIGKVSKDVADLVHEMREQGA